MKSNFQKTFPGHSPRLIALIASLSAAGAVFPSAAFSADKDQSQGSVEVSRDTHHNPLTHKTTTTITRKSKVAYAHKAAGQKSKADGEDRQEVQKTVSDDGKSASVKVESKHSENGG